MITKIVIKDYVAKRCPYLASLELEDKSLVQLLEESIENQDKYKELIAEQQENEDSDPDEVFNLIEIFKDYPHLKEVLKKFAKYQKKNKAEQLIEKYNDDQIVSKLSRRYFELKYGKENCARCDINADGKELVNQEAIISLTNQYLADKNIKVIFEGQLEFNELRARFDVLIRQDDGTFSLIEVKGSNSVFKKTTKKDCEFETGIKDKYLYDLLFQYYVYTRAGLNISRLSYMYTDREFNMTELTYPTADKDLDKLFIVKSFIELKEGTMSLMEYFDSDTYVDKKIPDEERDEYTIEGIISRIREIADEKGISPSMNYRCVKGPMCPFTHLCFGDAATEPNSLFKLTRWGSYGGNWRGTDKLLGMGITKISEIPDNFDGYPEMTKTGKRSNAHTQIDYQKGKIKEKYVIDNARVKDTITRDYLNDEIEYLLFFDFESFQYPIPLVEKTPAWKQTVSQYSMHVVKKGYNLAKHDFAKGKGGEVTHFEYIANPDLSGYTNPSIELYETLKTQLESVGIDPYAKNYRVVVFNRNFEKTRMNEFVKDFAVEASLDLKTFVQNFNDNVVDLLDFFTSGAIYCRDFNGRGSLKVVQPTLAADKDVLDFYNKKLPFDLTYSLDYHKEDKCLVYNGGICLDLYKSLLVRAHLGGQKKGEPSTQELLDEALAYCKIDSWGTVIIYDVIKNVYLGKLRLDALYK